MKKINAAVTIIAFSVVPTFLAGCAVSDDIARELGKRGSKLGNLADDVAPPIPKKVTAVVPSVTRNANLDKYLKKCSRQAGKSAVIEAWQRANSSNSRVSESYLQSVARDAIQKCIFGKAADRRLDELANELVNSEANSVVLEFKQEYQVEVE